jgi:SulP family sulfate permease
MPKRYLAAARSPIHLKLFHALKAKFREGYKAADLRADLLAGIVVALVAVPLGMALAIASGAPPQHGLYTVILGGGLVALLGGSRCQVTGPTAAFVVILAPIVQQHGLPGLFIAGAMAGIMLILAGLFGMGRLIQFIPYPVTTGFTAGIGVVISTLQLKDFFGLKNVAPGETYFQKLAAIVSAFPSLSIGETLIGVATLVMLVQWPKFNRRIPAPLIALSVATVLGLVLKFLGVEIATIASRFTFESGGQIHHGIPQAPPGFAWPWSYPGAKGAPFQLDLATLQALIPSAFAIAMLGAIESLLSAVVADGMARTRHDPDAELTALGIGNVICPFFGAIPATGAIARTATNIRYGARSPIAAIAHAFFVLLILLIFAPLIGYLPLSSMAALLILVAYNMAEVKHFVHIAKVAPRSDVSVLMACFSLTVVFDMVIGVTAGVLLAALLFLRRMSSLTSGRELTDTGLHAKEPTTLPKGLILYEIAGPLFFGAAERAMDALGAITDPVHVVVFLMDRVPTMDVTGLVALESAVRKHCEHGRVSILAGVQEQPLELMLRSTDLRESPLVMYAPNVIQAVERGTQVLAGLKAKSAVPLNA